MRTIWRAGVLAVLAGATVPPATQAADGYRGCKGGVQTDGSIVAEFGFYRAVKVKRIDCPNAKTVMQKFVLKRGPITAFPERSMTIVVRLNGRNWSCRTTFIPDRTDTNGDWWPPYERIGCKATGGRRVKFIGAS